WRDHLDKCPDGLCGPPWRYRQYSRYPPICKPLPESRSDIEMRGRPGRGSSAPATAPQTTVCRSRVRTCRSGPVCGVSEVEGQVVELNLEGGKWELGNLLAHDRAGFGRVYEAVNAAGKTAVVKLVPREPGADRELLF